MFTLGLLDRYQNKFLPLHTSPINISFPANRPKIMMDILIILPYLIELDKLSLMSSSVWMDSKFRIESKSRYPPCIKIMQQIVVRKERVFEKKWNFIIEDDAIELVDRLCIIFERMLTKPDTLLFHLHNNNDISLIAAIDSTATCVVKGFFQPFGDRIFITTLEEALSCLLDLAKSVASLIELGIVHHDISIDNIMKKGNKYFLVDFDDAFCVDESTRQCPAIDPRRLSPDKHCTGGIYSDHGHEVDIWSIGQVMISFKINNDGIKQLLDLGGIILREYQTMSIDQVINAIEKLKENC